MQALVDSSLHGGTVLYFYSYANENDHFYSVGLARLKDGTVVVVWREQVGKDETFWSWGKPPHFPDVKLPSNSLVMR